jgi:Arc/MetJ-type ribon-helix-helix transcriptional regulator
MSFSLNPETLKLIEERRLRGGYATADDLLCAAMNSLEQQESLDDFAPGEMLDLIRAGQGSGAPLDGEAVLEELRNLRLRR